MRQEILQQLHIGHFRMEKTEQRTRYVVYYPRLNTEVEMFVVGCSICQEHKLATQKESTMNRPITARPFQNVFECEGKNYSSLQDYNSRNIAVDRFYSTRASFVITKMKGIFARHQRMSLLITDLISPAEILHYSQIYGDSSFGPQVSDTHNPIG